MIGVFDSGIGGLTIVKAIRRRMPAVDIIYFGDTARAPYGNKSREIIEKYTSENVRFLKEYGATVIVAACHSASSLAHDFLHKEAGVPMFDVVDPSIQAALRVSKIGRIGVIGTRATINSGMYQKLLPQTAVERGGSLGYAGKIQVFTKPCPLFVPLVEENWINRPETKMIARAYLQDLKLKKIDTLILACTHFPFLRRIIQARVGRGVILVDPGEEVTKELEKFLQKEMPHLLNGGGQLRLHFSDINQRQHELVKNWLDGDN